MTDTAKSRRQPRALRDVDQSRMTLTEHLFEFRERLVKSLLALVVTVVVAFVFFPEIFAVIQRPYCDLPAKYRFDPGGDCKLYFFGVIDGFTVRMQVSLIVGALLASPVWLYQLAAFVTPGLHRRERRWAFPFVAISLVLFTVGGFFAYLTLDRGLLFLFGIAGEDITPLLGAKQYLSFFSLMLLAFGVSFELPLLLVFLELVGVVDAAKLRRWRRQMYFALALFTALITPSQDPITFLAMWVPMVIFYEAAVVFARVHGRAKARRGGTEQWADDESSPVEPAEPV